MEQVSYHRSQYTGLLVNLFRKIFGLLRRTPNYRRIGFFEKEELGPRRSRFSFKGRRRVKFAGLRSGRPSSAAGKAAEGGDQSGAGSRVRGFRIRRKNVTAPLVSLLKRMRDAYVKFMLDLASNGNRNGMLAMHASGHGGATAFPTQEMSDRELMQRLHYLNEVTSRRAT